MYGMCIARRHANYLLAGQPPHHSGPQVLSLGSAPPSEVGVVLFSSFFHDFERALNLHSLNVVAPDSHGWGGEP